MNAYAESSVRSKKDEDLSRTVPLGECHLPSVIRKYMLRYHEERNHQGLDNRPKAPIADVVGFDGPIAPRIRVGGVLSHYFREAA